MQAIMLGSAAAEGIPAIFCGCKTCRHARATGGKEIRARTSLFLPPDTIIDFGPDLMYAVHRFGLDLTGLRHVLVTHSHEDHLLPDNLDYAHAPFAHERAGDLTVYGNDNSMERIRRAYSPSPAEINLRPVRPMERFRAGEAEVAAIHSNHRPGELTLNYVISRGGRSLLYACDTGWYAEETWRFLKNFTINTVVMECTYGLRSCGQYNGHLGFPELVAMKQRLESEGILAPDAQYIMTHYSHNGVGTHEEMQAVASEQGIIVGYDGLSFDI